MALVRCQSCGIKPPGRGTYKRAYVRAIKPLNHPSSGVICGTPSCSNPGLIWLEEAESQAYNSGERVFKLQTHTVKVRAQ